MGKSLHVMRGSVLATVIAAACTGEDADLSGLSDAGSQSDSPNGTDAAGGDGATGGGDAGLDVAEAGCPAKGSASALAFVDPTSGVDDQDHGTAYGACAYKTLTYALTQATGEIALQTATYAKNTGETPPFVLQGAQKLLCKHQTAGRAKLEGKETFGSIKTVVAMTGGENLLSDCIVDGQGAAVNGYCIDVTASGTSNAAPNRIKNTEVTNCGNGNAIQVENGISYLVLEGSNVHDNGAGTGIFWTGTTTGGNMLNNAFTNNGVDVWCSSANVGLNGTGNKGLDGGGIATCNVCAGCFFP